MLPWVFLALIPFAILVKFPRVKKKPFRSLWAGTPILTLPNLAAAEKILGIKSSTFVSGSYYITEDFDYNLSRKFGPYFKLFASYPAFVWACWSFQRFHFFCDRGILPNTKPFNFNKAELIIYKLLKKEVLFYTYGADVRTRKKSIELGVYNCCMECQSVGKACVCDERLGIANTTFISRYANAIFSMGDMIEYTPGSRNNLFFWPIDLYSDNGQKYVPSYPDQNNEKPMRIVHASNHRHFKGTRFLISAVERLQARGVNVELKLVEKIPNDKALEIYRTADIVFDQCIIGFHGFLTIEAMAMGKPVMCYIRKPNEYLLHPEEMPIINCKAEEVESTIRACCSDRRLLYERGVAGRRYVEKYFTLEAFAERLKRIYIDLELKV